MRLLLKSLLFVFSALFVAACSDDSEGVEYLFDRSVQDVSVLKSCATTSDSVECFQLRWRVPIETENLARFHIWLDTTYIGDTTKSVPKNATEHSIQVEYHSGALYDTLDLSALVSEYLDRDSLHIAIWCEYTDDNDAGSVQHLYVHFGDDLPPSSISVQDSVWTTGVVLDWARPTDQTDFYKPSELSGRIVGYNVLLYAQDTTEDIRNVKVKLEWDGGVDSLGNTGYKRHARYKANNDSIWLSNVDAGVDVKNYLRLAVIDGAGFDFENADANRFRITVEGLRAQHYYTIGITSWDSAGNSSGSGGTGSVATNQLFITTDSIAPLMPTAVWTRPDSLYPKYAALDSNRVILFWSRSIDPLVTNHNITVDSVLTIPNTCKKSYPSCYRDVQTYMVELWNGESFEAATGAGGESETRYADSYLLQGNSMVFSLSGTFVTDTIRWVVPRDTLIVRIRSIDSSGYYSVALIDTIPVTPGPENDLACPKGFVPVRTSDTTRFCIERFEHQDSDSTFMHDVLYSEALAACKSMDASGFTVSLCKENDWEKACRAETRVTYGVIEESDFSASEYLFRYCNVGTDDSTGTYLLANRNPKCVSPDGIRDLPGSYQEWTIGRKKDTVEVLKGTSYALFSEQDRSSLAKCTSFSTPYRLRAAYTQDTVYLYRNASKVDTTTTKDTSRTLYATLTQKDFRDTLQYFTVTNPKTGDVLGEDYVLMKEYRSGGEEWLKSIANGLIYKKDHIKVVFLLGTTVNYRNAAAFYRDPTISFRCCAYPE